MADVLSNHSSSDYIRQLLLIETYERNELDTIHSYMFHANAQSRSRRQQINTSKSSATRAQIATNDMDGNQKISETMSLTHNEYGVYDIENQYMSDVEHKMTEMIPLNAKPTNSVFEADDIEDIITFFKTGVTSKCWIFDLEKQLW
eukprot:310175_1